MEWIGWILAAILAVIALWLYSRRGGAEGGYRAYPQVDRHGMAFVTGGGGGGAQVTGGPESHIAHPTHKVKWKLVNATGADQTVQLTVLSHTPSTAPDNPFTQQPPFTQAVTPNVGNAAKTYLTLTVRPAADFPNVECKYTYAMHIAGTNSSTGLDPELDIWP